jgi:hypothetical protein
MPYERPSSLPGNQSVCTERLQMYTIEDNMPNAKKHAYSTIGTVVEELINSTDAISMVKISMVSFTPMKRVTGVPRPDDPTL